MRMQPGIIRNYKPSESGEKTNQTKRPAVFQKRSALCRGCSQTFSTPYVSMRFHPFHLPQKLCLHPSPALCILLYCLCGEIDNTFSSQDSNITSVKKMMAAV